MNIETGTVSLRTMVLAIGVAVGAGISWQAVLGGIKADADEQAEIKKALKSNEAKVDRLAMVICLADEAAAMRCKQLGVLQ